ncbi:NADPH-dependent FMN reductase [uncultured Xylophilus sp.]|uniref:NADPH-dependent FMN reductase n=1 Tax=uncultured Xylophilus sp. TaxID=296832 RepID=UPI002600F007|nr:NADPH-dependent FMN reductase [uncultured Xylophilus sp.]
MTVLLIAGSPTERSRSQALLEAVGQRLSRAGRTVERLPVRQLDPTALLVADASERGIARAVDQLATAQAVVVATPVYKAAYSGLLKVFLDLLPQTALQGKTVLPLATGGSPHHMLALDYALRPVLQSLSARHILSGVYATDSQVTWTPEGAFTLADEIGRRIDAAVEALSDAIAPTVPRPGFAPIAFAQVQHSV